MRYILTAQLDGTTRTVRVIAEDSFDATMQAIDIVLDRASRFPAGTWALGRIELKDSTGKIIHYMNAKAAA